MKKMRMESQDLTQANIDKIAELFPGAITEARDESGKLKKAVNFELLKQLLSSDVVDDDEAYEFTWVGKKASIVEAGKPIRKTLRPCKAESKNWESTENLYIEGDNLDVLKLLQESYLGKVKMIYIDPPYNTGNDFIYRDNFTMDKDDYDEEAGMYDENGDKLFRNTESNGRFHSDWCSMMYPRLVLARNLLRNDGFIFISIDDREASNLKTLCDEVFGATSRLGTFVWKRRQMVDSRSKTGISEDHEYALCYSKMRGSRLRGQAPDLSKYSNPDGDPRGDWMSADMTGLATASQRPNLHYELTNQHTGITYSCPSSGWRYEKKRMLELVESNEVLFPANENGRPRRKKFVKDLSGEYAGFSTLLDTVYNTQATREVKALFDGNDYFDFPKPVELIKIFITQGVPTQDEQVVLDFFSGSATTAHAVMQLNAEDGGNRKFIMVQLPEECAPDSEAAKAGYANICEIGKERIRRAGDKIKADNAGKDGIESLDTGFRVLKLDSTNMKDVYYGADEYDQKSLTDFVSNIKEDRTDIDLLYGCLLEWGLPLSLPHTSEKIDGVTVHTYNNGDLMACFAEKISEAVVREIAKRQPLRVVFRDSSFASAPAKINVEEIFKLMAPNTTVRVI